MGGKKAASPSKSLPENHKDTWEWQEGLKPFQIRIQVNYELLTAYETPEIHFAEIRVIVRSPGSSYVPLMSHLKSISEILNLPTLNLKKLTSENNHACIGCLVQTQTLFNTENSALSPFSLSHGPFPLTSC